MYRNPYGYYETSDAGLTGDWYYPTQGATADAPSQLQNPHTTRRQDPWYRTGDSIGNNNPGHYGYSAQSNYPYWSQFPAGRGYPSGEEWSYTRPAGLDRYGTYPLGVYGVTDNDDYDWSRTNNCQPTDREYWDAEEGGGFQNYRGWH